MRIIHTSDWHIGRTLHGADLTAAHLDFFAQLEAMIKQRKVDILLISGDLFDRAIPSLESLELAKTVIGRLTKSCTVIITPGNHDSATRLGFLAPYLHGHLKILAEDDALDHPQTFTNPDNPKDQVEIWGIPYLHPDLYRQKLADGYSYPISKKEPKDKMMLNGQQEKVTSEILERSHQAVLAAALRRIGRAKTKIRSTDSTVIIMAHAFVQNALSCESERDITVGGIPHVSCDIFTTYGGLTEIDNRELKIPDYIALGHLHRPQKIDYKPGRPIFRYSGSPLPFSFSESTRDICDVSNIVAIPDDTESVNNIQSSSDQKEQKQHRHLLKSVVYMDTQKEDLGIELLPIRLYRPLTRLRGKLVDITGNQTTQFRNDFVEITITDEQRPPHLLADLKQAFPNLLSVIYEPTQLETSQKRLTKKQIKQHPYQVTLDYFKQYSNNTIEENELNLIKAIYDHAKQSLDA